MSSLKQIQLEAKTAARHRQAVMELNTIARDIERSEKTILALNGDLEVANSKYRGPRSTREDVAYLTLLLECAKRKLAWEKQIASLQKRAPELMQRLNAMMSDVQAPPSAEVRQEILQALQAIQEAMKRLEAAHGGEPASAGTDPKA